MSQNVQETIDELRCENLELKLSSIKKEMAMMKVDFHRHMDLIMETNSEKFSKILEQTSKTNGSVARAMEKIADSLFAMVDIVLGTIRQPEAQNRKEMIMSAVTNFSNYAGAVLSNMKAEDVLGDFEIKSEKLKIRILSLHGNISTKSIF